MFGGQEVVVLSVRTVYNTLCIDQNCLGANDMLHVVSLHLKHRHPRANHNPLHHKSKLFYIF